MKKITINALLLSIGGMLFFSCTDDSLVSVNEDPVSTQIRAKGGNGNGNGGNGGNGSDSITWRITLTGDLLSGTLDFSDGTPTKNQDFIEAVDYNNAEWTMNGFDNLVPPTEKAGGWLSCFGENGAIPSSLTGGIIIRHATGKKRSDKAWANFNFTSNGVGYILQLYSNFPTAIQSWIPNELGESITITTREWRIWGPEPCGYSADLNEPIPNHDLTIEVIALF